MRSGYFNEQFCVHKLIEIMLILLVVSPTLAGWRLPGDGTPVPVTSRRITVLAGQTALLPCVVSDQRDKVVSWIRNRDLHILTSGIFSFTSDNRFEVIHRPENDFWGLEIKNTQISDSGKYECQLNTDPKLNFPIILTVTDSHMHDSPMDEARRGSATIHGPLEQHVRVGTTITFTCSVSRTEKARASRAMLKWTHAGRDVTFQSSRGGISMDTDYRDESVTSRLTVAMVTQQDAGDYTCEDLDVVPATVTLHVFEGERSEAMQSGAEKILQLKAFSSLFFLYFNWVLR